MAAEFNDLLRSARIAPEEVRLLRHHTDGGLGGMSLFELWRNDRDGYELYQSTQKRNRPLFRTGRYWASFASPAHGETVFTGLYEVSYKDTRVVEWSCPFRGSAVGKGEAVDVFETKLRPELADHIGALHVAWPLTSIRSWARYASNAQLRIVSAGPSQTATPSKNQFLIEALLRMGFIQKHRTQRLTQLRRGHLIVYVKREVLRLPFVIHPYFFDLASDLAVHAGVDLENPLDFYIDSNLSEFPVYQSDRRADKGRFGFALGVRTERLARLVEILERGSVIQTEAGETRAIGTPEEPLTEQERLVAARIGQGDFRTALLARWKVCPVTNVDHNELLCASHIKPWAVATPRERLDPFNGLLLSAHIDALFDRGLISFTDDGALLISKLLSSENISRLGLNAEARLDGLGDRHAPYLAFHRKDVFRQ